MRTIYADFNALTETEAIRLTTRGSEEDVRKLGVQPGDWVWLSDGEMVVGARVDEDSRHRLVGTPAWDTLVDLIDDPPMSLSEIESELNTLIGPGVDSLSVDERRVLQLLTWWERKAPNAHQGLASLTTRRALALMALGHDALARGAFEEALVADPNDSYLLSAFIFLLSKIEPERALREAESQMAKNPAAIIIAASVHALSCHAVELSGEEFRASCRRALDWSSSFDSAPGRGEVPAATVALVRFNQGLAELGLGAVAEARERFKQAQVAEPDERVIDDALALNSYNQQAREVAARYRRRQFPGRRSAKLDPALPKSA